MIVAQLGGRDRAHRPDARPPARPARLAETDQVRSALLSAVSHDLRRPLAAAVAAVGGLRAAATALADDDRRRAARDGRREPRAPCRRSSPTCSTSAACRPACSRSRSAPSMRPTSSSPRSTSSASGPAEVELALDPDLPAVAGRPGAAAARARERARQRARGTRPPARRVRVATSRLGGVARDPHHRPRPRACRAERRDDIFAPFQRLGDTDNTAGLGLGLALSQGVRRGHGRYPHPRGHPGRRPHHGHRAAAVAGDPPIPGEEADG